MTHYKINLSLDSVKVEETTTSLIREYLAKKGLKRTLATLDEESPRNDKSISSRTKLVEYLKIAKLYDYNKNSVKIYSTILELLTSYLMSNDIMGNKPLEPSQFNRQNDLIVYDADKEGIVSEGSEKRIDGKQSEKDDSVKINVPSNKSTNPTKTKAIFNNNKEEKSKIEVKVTPKFKDNEISPPLVTNSLISTETNDQDDEFEKLLEMKRNKLKTKNESKSDDKKNLIESQIEHKKEPQEAKQMSEAKKTGNVDDIPKQIVSKKPLEIASKEKIINPSPNVLKQDYQVVPIDFETASSLRLLIFGSINLVFNDEWKYQSFKFSDYVKLKYGLVQKRGGPCGVMASVQAYFLIELLFSHNNQISPELFDINKRDRSKLLGQAIAKLLWKSGEETNQAVVCVPTQRAHFAPHGKYRSDGLTETLNLLHFDNYKSLEGFLIKNISVFENEDSSGCILLLYSAIFSRSIKKIQEDMDEPTGKLMGQHGYCTQDMVNLLIHGKAFSNVFNDLILLDKLKLKGPNKRNDIGLLSLFEHYKSCEVGSNLKTPKYPIWIVCSESHFSTIFSLKKEILNDWKAENRFDLYYYDGLANQNEQIRLTISAPTNYFGRKSIKEDSVTPPLELVIRTKWKDADIDWNGTEPIL